MKTAPPPILPPGTPFQRFDALFREVIAAKPIPKLKKQPKSK